MARLPVPSSRPVPAAHGERALASHGWDLVRGSKQVLDCQPLLERIAATTGQTGAMDDLRYFLALPQNQRKTPVLVLQRSAGPAGPKAALLAFEYRLPGGLRSRIVSSADTTGRRTLLAPPELRARFAGECARVLMDHGVSVVHLSVSQPVPQVAATEQVEQVFCRGSHAPEREMRWSLTPRTFPLYLPLAATLDETLARIGQRTRSNLRYYRRRAERDLQCTFVDDVRLTLPEMLQLNRLSMYPVPLSTVLFRHQASAVVRNPFCCGVRAQNGQWLSIVSGRRSGRDVEIDWQMNLAALPRYSLSTVARSYLIEREIARGSQRLLIEGGTPQAIAQSFLPGHALELTVVRRSIVAGVLCKLLPSRNYVAQILRAPGLGWHAC